MFVYNGAIAVMMSVLQSADNTVDGLSRLEEEGYTYAHYYGHGGHKTFKEDYK